MDRERCKVVRDAHTRQEGASLGGHGLWLHNVIRDGQLVGVVCPKKVLILGGDQLDMDVGQCKATHVVHHGVGQTIQWIARQWKRVAERDVMDVVTVMTSNID